jgi:hypothetical protein
MPGTRRFIANAGAGSGIAKENYGIFTAVNA